MSLEARIAAVTAAIEAMPACEANPMARGVTLYKVMGKIDDLRQARTQRINLSHASSSATQWLALTIIAFITQMVIALAHSDRPAGAAAALGAFSLAAIVALFYLGWADGLIGPSKIDSAIVPLRDVLATVSGA